MVSTYVHDSVCINAYKYTCMEEEEKEALSLLTNDSFCLRSESMRGLEGEKATGVAEGTRYGNGGN